MCVITHEICEAIVTVLEEGNFEYHQVMNDIQEIVDSFISRWQFPLCAGALTFPFLQQQKTTLTMARN